VEDQEMMHQELAQEIHRQYHRLKEIREETLELLQLMDQAEVEEQERQELLELQALEDQEELVYQIVLQDRQYFMQGEEVE
jgi:hypothetical protein